MKKKLLLVCGCPRSGTTLLNVLLNSHPNISITNELDLYKLSFDLHDLLFSKYKKRSNASFNRPKSIRENWSDKDVLSYTPSNKEILFNTIYNYCNSINNKKDIMIFGDKLPLYYKYDLKKLAELFNCELYCINVTRDIKEVLTSMNRRYQNNKKGLDRWRGYTNFKYAINTWIDAWNNRFVYNDSKVHYLDLNYNKCIENTSEFLDLLSSFLNIENLFDDNIISNDDITLDNNYHQIILHNNEIEKYINLKNHPINLTNYGIEIKKTHIKKYNKIFYKYSNNFYK